MCNGQRIPAVCNEERHAAKDYKKSALRKALLDPTDAGDLEWAAAQSALMQIESLLYHANAHDDSVGIRRTRMHIGKRAQFAHE